MWPNLSTTIIEQISGKSKPTRSSKFSGATYYRVYVPKDIILALKIGDEDSVVWVKRLNLKGQVEEIVVRNSSTPLPNNILAGVNVSQTQRPWAQARSKVRFYLSGRSAFALFHSYKIWVRLRQKTIQRLLVFAGQILQWLQDTCRARSTII